MFTIASLKFRADYDMIMSLSSTGGLGGIFSVTSTFGGGTDYFTVASINGVGAALLVSFLWIAAQRPAYMCKNESGGRKYIFLCHSTRCPPQCMNSVVKCTLNVPNSRLAAMPLTVLGLCRFRQFSHERSILQSNHILRYCNV